MFSGTSNLTSRPSIDSRSISIADCKQLAHVTPFLFGPDHSAFESIHVEKIVDDAIEPMRAVVDLAGELLSMSAFSELSASARPVPGWRLRSRRAES